MTTFQVTEVQKALKGFDYPAGPAELAEHAEGNGAPRELVDLLGGLDKGSFDGPNAVMHALSGSLGGPTPDGPTERETKDVQGPAFQVTEVQKALKGAHYPMDGKALADLARTNGGSAELVDALSGIREVDGPNTVMQEIKDHLGGPAS